MFSNISLKNNSITLYVCISCYCIYAYKIFIIFKQKMYIKSNTNNNTNLIFIKRMNSLHDNCTNYINISCVSN